MTREAHIAVQAILRQRVELVASEFQLLIRGDQFNHVRLIDVAQLVLRLHEVIARIQIAVVLQRQRRAARLGEHTQPRRLAIPVRQRHIEHLHVDFTDVVPHPLFKYADQELPILFGCDDRSVTSLPKGTPSTW